MNKNSNYTIDQKIEYHQRMIKELLTELDYRTTRVQKLYEEQLQIEISKYNTNAKRKKAAR